MWSCARRPSHLQQEREGTPILGSERPGTSYDCLVHYFAGKGRHPGRRVQGRSRLFGCRVRRGHLRQPGWLRLSPASGRIPRDRAQLARDAHISGDGPNLQGTRGSGTGNRCGSWSIVLLIQWGCTHSTGRVALMESWEAATCNLLRGKPITDADWCDIFWELWAPFGTGVEQGSHPGLYSQSCADPNLPRRRLAASAMWSQRWAVQCRSPATWSRSYCPGVCCWALRYCTWPIRGSPANAPFWWHTDNHRTEQHFTSVKLHLSEIACMVHPACRRLSIIWYKPGHRIKPILG